MYYLTYINSKRKEIHKYFDSYEKALEFTRELDKRIERKTCGGYILSLC